MRLNTPVSYQTADLEPMTDINEARTNVPQPPGSRFGPVELFYMNLILAFVDKPQSLTTLAPEFTE